MKLNYVKPAQLHKIKGLRSILRQIKVPSLHRRGRLYAVKYTKPHVKNLLLFTMALTKVAKTEIMHHINIIQ